MIRWRRGSALDFVCSFMPPAGRRQPAPSYATAFLRASRRFGAVRACGVSAAGTVPSAPEAGVCGLEASRKRIVAGERAVRDRDLPALRAPQLLPERVAVRLHGSRRDPEPSRDLVVGASGGNQLHDLTLAGGHGWGAAWQGLSHGLTLPTLASSRNCPKGVFRALRRPDELGLFEERRGVRPRLGLGGLGFVERADP
jgi:hypothetical protein